MPIHARKLSDERKVEFSSRLNSSFVLIAIALLLILFGFLSDSRHNSSEPYIDINGFAYYIPIWANSIFLSCIIIGFIFLFYEIALELDNCFIKSQHNKKIIWSIWTLFAGPFIALNVLILYYAYWGKNQDWQQIAPIIYFGLLVATILICIPLYNMQKKSSNANKFNNFFFPFISLIILIAISGVIYLIAIRGMVTVLYIVMIPVCCDVGGYIFGVFFGTHKLAPKVSPKKTWEGVIGSLVFSFVIILTLTALLGLGNGQSHFQLQGNIFGNQWDQLVTRNAGINPGEVGWWFFVLFMLLILIVVSIFGDLFFSVFKRKNNIKDYSNLIKGHGGVLDRIDSWVIVFSVFFTITLMIAGISTLASGWRENNRIFNIYYVS